MRFDLGTLDSGERSLSFGLLVTIYGSGGHLSHVTQTPPPPNKLSFPHPIEVALTGQAVSEEKMFENGGRQPTDGRRSLPIL